MQRPLDLSKLASGKHGDTSGKRALRNRRDGVEVHLARSREPLFGSDGNLGRNPSHAGGHGCDRHQLANPIGGVAGEQQYRAMTNGLGELSPPDLAAAYYHSSSGSKASLAVASAAAISAELSGVRR